jgi:hypothetical protein
MFIFFSAKNGTSPWLFGNTVKAPANGIHPVCETRNFRFDIRINKDLNERNLL